MTARIVFRLLLSVFLGMLREPVFYWELYPKRKKKDRENVVQICFNARDCFSYAKKCREAGIDAQEKRRFDTQIVRI